MQQVFTVPLEVLTDPELKNAERRVLLALCSFGGLAGKVHPSAQVLCERAHIRSPAQLSRITSSLQWKGWLVKKRLGNFGRLVYTLRVPAARECA